jgi:hypothetical protein
LNDLLEDKRFTPVRRHLRRAYLNPVDEGIEWTLVSSADSGIQGIRVSALNVGRIAMQERYFLYRSPN